MKEIFSPHLHLAKKYWKEHLRPGDSAIDATCGNGHDTLYLAELLLSDPHGSIAAYDIQLQALQNTEALLKQHLSSEQLKRVHLHHSSHSEMILSPPPRLIIYNLGYLPGSDKKVTTQTETTLESVKQSLLCETDAISITCYPGHPEGEREEKALLEFLEMLPKTWSVHYHRWLNRPKSPTLLWIEKSVSAPHP